MSAPHRQYRLGALIWECETCGDQFYGAKNLCAHFRQCQPPPAVDERDLNRLLWIVAGEMYIWRNEGQSQEWARIRAHSLGVKL